MYLNKWTIKNNYSLPLISDIVENIGTKQVFTKMDLRWGYNKERRQVEGSIHDTREVIQANGDILWIDKLICKLSDHDK